jgi:hypothetical protein
MNYTAAKFVTELDLSDLNFMDRMLALFCIGAHMYTHFLVYGLLLVDAELYRKLLTKDYCCTFSRGLFGELKNFSCVPVMKAHFDIIFLPLLHSQKLLFQ